VLSDNLSMAGFYGELDITLGVPPIPVALPDPCSTNTGNIGAALQLAAQGYNATGQTNQIAALPPLCGFTYTAGNALSLKTGSDIVAIRRASTATPIVQGAALAGTHYLQVSLCQYDATTYIVDTTPANFTLRTTGCIKDNPTPYANLRNFIVQVYFISPHNTVGDGVPTLKRLELDAPTGNFVVTPLVEGIEYMQIDYGLDTDSDGAPDTYTAAPADTTAWSNVIAVKMNILARNTEATKGHSDTKAYVLGTAGNFGPFNDEYKRHAYTRVIRLTNPAGRRDPL
jgi:type IV pilus assembly protein PilW